ncbi:four-carbon acid sugar kinase family protein [Falsiroseomonas tokyonensis]|uniref:Four-carbon acid sugar kinase family protein n=1 Tax=Falsiroseomonas tokyonensis TaxID=430521 RepID=A0ABV7C1M4_9PROT|nr:four-carbon acid sugar kinase family protein [Falsiroseomonas tokyonensis]MBU8540978.1 hypothetical protein [Falsiroseomonas tokyonensis]
MTRPILRLLADDLTGALDSAAELTGLCGPVPLRWTDGAAPAGSLAIDTGTREVAREKAVVRLRRMAPHWRGADIAFKKIDSLLRGHVAAELAACMAMGAWHHVVLAPAFPAQGRITREGHVLVRQAEGGFRALAPSLPELLAGEGLQPQRGQPGGPLPPGLSIFDAEEEADLAAVVALGRTASAPVLWCGSGGLARALAASAPACTSQALPRPVLGLFGSDQPATARQLAACGEQALRIAGGDDAVAARIGAMLRDQGVAMVGMDLPGGLARDVAAARIAGILNDLIPRLPAPTTLVAAGGETLRAICEAAGASGLQAVGLVQPGVPRSVLRGGAWDGVTVVSKSGAFGSDALWRDLLAEPVTMSWSLSA